MKSWVEILDAPWSGNPEVVVVLCPKGSESKILQTTDNRLHIGVLQRPKIRKQLGLQVLVPHTHSYEETEQILEERGFEMAPCHYRGPLADVPQRLLVTSGYPLVFLANNMSHVYLNLKAAIHSKAPVEVN